MEGAATRPLPPRQDHARLQPYLGRPQFFLGAAALFAEFPVALLVREEEHDARMRGHHPLAEGELPPLRASRTRRVGPERFEVKGLVEMFDTLDGKQAVGDIVEAHEDRETRLRTARMLCLLESCDLARPA